MNDPSANHPSVRSPSLRRRARAAGAAWTAAHGARAGVHLLLAVILLVLPLATRTVAADDDGDNPFRTPKPKQKPSAPAARPGSAPRSSGPPVRPGPNQEMPQPRRIDGGNGWSIVLGTFTGPDHVQTATVTRDRLAQRMPEFRDAYVRSNAHGSAVLWGRFSGPEDPNAKRELDRIQGLVFQNARPFARAMLTRFETTASAPSGPNDLRNLRRQYPKVDPLYTLQVAVWADFDGTVALDSIRRSAETFAMQLRSQGYPAYYHHDDDLKMSVVTIGAFDHTAYDPKSTLFSPELEALFRKFPKHLVNGQPMMLKTNPRDPNSTEYPQPCTLMLVPN
ncbi:MAG: hypothetical protein KDA22_09470 [Phycisphaerales bacterium]|nr:hypothetical protein [Phycisphaerales bacterium]